MQANGCELSGPAFMINEEAHSNESRLHMQLSAEARPAPASTNLNGKRFRVILPYFHAAY